MLNGIDLKNKEIEFSALLYKNSRELIGVLPREIIKGITYKFEDCYEIDIEVEKYMMTEKSLKKVLNPLYTKINSRQQVVINNKDRFILIDKTTTSDKRKGIKTFKGYSMEYTLNKRRVSLEGKERQLYRGNNQSEITDGILDIFKRETGWKVDYVSEDASKELVTTMETVDVNLYTNYSKQAITNETVLFDKEVSINLGLEKPLIMEINYVDFKILNTENQELVTFDTITHEFEILYTGIKRIRCTYDTTQTSNRYSVNYEITFLDDTTKIINKSLKNITDLNISAGSIFIKYETREYKILNVYKYRYFESVDTNWLPFLRDEVQKSFNVVFFFDTINKKISAYSREEVGKLSNLYLSYDSCIQESTFTEVNDEVCTRLKVISSNDISINSENILGTDYVECFDYLIKKGTISDELLDALQRYENKLVYYQNLWVILRDEKQVLDNQRIQLEAEIKIINERVKVQNDLLIAYISSSQEDMQLVTKTKIEELQARAEVCLNSMVNILTNLSNISDQMISISFAIQKENIADEQGKIFNTDLLDEYNTEHIIESTYEDSDYTDAYSLYDYAKQYIKELNKIKIEISLTLDDLNRLIKDESGFEGKINLGDYIILGDKEIMDEVEDYKLRLTQYKIIPSDNCKIADTVFTNGDKQKQMLKSIGNLSRKSANTSNLAGKYKSVWENSIDSNSFVQTFKENGLDLSSQSITGSSSNGQIEINECGVFITDKNNKNLQTYIGSNLYAISSDGFKSSTVAIMPEGINASMLVGKLLLSEDFSIANDEETFSINSDGLTIREINEIGENVDKIILGIQEIDGVKKAVLRLIGENGETYLTEKGIITQNQFVVWDNVSNGFPMQIPYVVDEGVVSCKKVLLNLILEKYRAFERGVGAGGDVTTSGASSNETSSASSSSTTDEKGLHGHTSLMINQEDFTPPTEWKWVKLKCNYGDVEGTPSTEGYIAVMYDGATIDEDYITSFAKNGDHAHTNDHTHTNPHTHEINFNHTHDVFYGISQEESYPTNVKVYVNDVLVVENINANTQIDITNNIILNSTNNIKIESDTNGRITCNVFAKNFTAF